MANATIPRTDARSSTRIETARLALCGASVLFIHAVDHRAGLPEVGQRLERLRAASADYLAAIEPPRNGYYGAS